MSEAKILPFPQRRHRGPRSPSVEEAQQGRFMIVRGVDRLDDELDGLPDDVVAFAFRRMVREFRLGRALEDRDAAKKLDKHVTTVVRLRKKHGDFMTLMDERSEHARAKISAKKISQKSAKSLNFLASKPAENCDSEPPDSRTKLGLSPYGDNNTNLGDETSFAADAESAANADRRDDQEGEPPPTDSASPAQENPPRPAEFWETGFYVPSYHVEMEEIARQQDEERIAENRRQAEKWRAVCDEAARITSDLPKPDPHQGRMT